MRSGVEGAELVLLSLHLLYLPCFPTVLLHRTHVLVRAHARAGSPSLARRPPSSHTLAPILAFLASSLVSLRCFGLKLFVRGMLVGFLRWELACWAEGGWVDSEEEARKRGGGFRSEDPLEEARRRLWLDGDILRTSGRTTSARRRRTCPRLPAQRRTLTFSSRLQVLLPLPLPLPLFSASQPRDSVSPS